MSNAESSVPGAVGEPRTVLLDHLRKYPALETSMRLIEQQLDAIEQEAGGAVGERPACTCTSRPAWLPEGDIHWRGCPVLGSGGAVGKPRTEAGRALYEQWSK